MKPHTQYVYDIISAMLPPSATLSVTDTAITVTCSSNPLDVARAVCAIMQVDLSDQPAFSLSNDKFTVSAVLD